MPHRLFRSLLALLAGISVASFIGAPAQAGPTVCSGVIQITSLAFNPPTVAPGQVSAATLSAWNCTDQSQQTTATWQGRSITPKDTEGMHAKPKPPAKSSAEPGLFALVPATPSA